MSVRPQPYRLDLGPVGSIEDLTSRLPELFASADEMFQMLFEDLATTAASSGTSSSSSSGIASVVNDTNVTGSILGTVLTLGWTGLLAQARGGVGKDTSAATDGQLLIGKTTDHSLNLATITAGANIVVTNGAGTITIAATGLHTLQYIPLANGDVGNPEIIFAAGDVLYVTLALP